MASTLTINRKAYLFLHIPKTGGSWIEEVATKLGFRGNETISTPGVNRHGLRHHYGNDYAGSFAVVRHPLKWYASYWKYRALRKEWRPFNLEKGWHPFRELEKCKRATFEEWIRTVVEIEPAFLTRMYEWYVGPPGMEHVNWVLQNEDLVNNFLMLLDKWGPITLEQAEVARAYPRVNESIIPEETPTI